MKNNFRDFLSGIIGKKKDKSKFENRFPELGLFSDNDKNMLEKIIGFQTSNIGYYEQAFVHRSLLRETEIQESNQRLEFLGDAILGMIIGEYLFDNHPKGREGDLTKLRSAFVKNSTLAKCAKSLKLDELLKTGDHAEKHIEKGFESMMSDVMEALIASIYFDKGYYKCRDFVLSVLLPIMNENKDQINKNYKSILLEKFQAERKPAPTYDVLKEQGPDHNKEFLVGVFFGEEKIGQGLGKTKKSAEQNAAKNALNIKG